MSGVKWIKLMVDVFDNQKIRQIENMPEGDGIIVVWFYILCLAGNVNDGGAIYLTRDVPYTDEMLATFMRRPLSLIKMALHVFERFGMIELVDDVLYITNWAKYQNVDGMERIRAQTRERVARHRAQKNLPAAGGNQAVTDCNVTSNVTVTNCNATDIEEDLDREVEVERDTKKECGAKAPPPAPSAPPAFTLPLKNGSAYPITQAEVDQYAKLYPAVDILQELRKMHGWCDGNPTRRKTKSGIKRFIASWLASEQDKHSYTRQAAPAKVNALDVLGRMLEEKP